jgi:hypothetical protein
MHSLCGRWTIHEHSVLDLIFIVGAAVYVEGHGIHTAATIFKDPLKYLMKTQPASKTQYPLIPQTYSYIRDDWQHLYSHYIYVSGVLVMSVVHMLAYRYSCFAPISGIKQRILLSIAVLFYGFLFAGTSANFPCGLTVGLVWIGVCGGLLASWLWYARRKVPQITWFNHRLLVIQFYLSSYLLALLLILIYIAIFGYKDRASAGIPLS